MGKDWDKILDDIFDLDIQNPWLGQSIEPPQSFEDKKLVEIIKRPALVEDAPTNSIGGGAIAGLTKETMPVYKPTMLRRLVPNIIKRAARKKRNSLIRDDD